MKYLINQLFVLWTAVNICLYSRHDQTCTLQTRPQYRRIRPSDANGRTVAASGKWSGVHFTHASTIQTYTLVRKTENWSPTTLQTGSLFGLSPAPNTDISLILLERVPPIYTTKLACTSQLNCPCFPLGEIYIV